MIFGPRDPAGTTPYPTDSFVLEGVTVPCAIVETPDFTFDPSTPGNESMVLVRKRGFSMNYRDRSYVLSVAVRAPAGSCAALGSEFVGVVEACGPAVTLVKPGDRVIGNGAYPFSGVPGVLAGLPGNKQSKEQQIVHEVKLLRIPDAISDEVAAGFPIGGQTTFSMVRRLTLRDGERVLVAGGRSNTSLFAIHALQALHPGIEIYASTTTDYSERRLKELGVRDVVRVNPDEPSFVDDPVAARVMKEHGGFDAVIDPFFDVHLVPAIFVMNAGGRYITCGMYDQTSHIVPKPQRGIPPALGAAMMRVMFLNLSIIGNCIGQTEDLQHALQSYADGKLRVIIDRVFDAGDAAAFLHRTYCAPERFGKVVYMYRRTHVE